MPKSNDKQTAMEKAIAEALEISNKQLKNLLKQRTADVDRLTIEAARLTAENQRLHIELARVCQSTLGIATQRLELAEVALRTIKRMRGPLRTRPVDWYLGHEAVTRAERYFDEVGPIV